eukprot:12584420-Ditylum_brightwellii.AAC.1
MVAAEECPADFQRSSAPVSAWCWSILQWAVLRLGQQFQMRYIYEVDIRSLIAISDRIHKTRDSTQNRHLFDRCKVSHTEREG